MFTRKIKLSLTQIKHNPKITTKSFYKDLNIRTLINHDIFHLDFYYFNIFFVIVVVGGGWSLKFWSLESSYSLESSSSKGEGGVSSSVHLSHLLCQSHLHFHQSSSSKSSLSSSELFSSSSESSSSSEEAYCYKFHLLTSRTRILVFLCYN